MDKKRRKEVFRRLIEWYERVGRRFPWRNEGLKPYDVLIAEMMLQKTRAEMVVKAYLSFLERYPDPRSLESATVEEIAQVLKPLGLYNRRARWMKTIAGVLIEKYGGKVPSDREALLDLPGLGMYNANAILCFAYNEPVPLIDVNVARVLGRVADIEVRGDLRRNEKLHKLVAQLVPRKDFKEFNWALIDLGATVCTSKNPEHDRCPLASLCKHVLQQKQLKEKLPNIKNKKG